MIIWKVNALLFMADYKRRRICNGLLVVSAFLDFCALFFYRLDSQYVRSSRQGKEICRRRFSVWTLLPGIWIRCSTFCTVFI